METISTPWAKGSWVTGMQGLLCKVSLTSNIATYWAFSPESTVRFPNLTNHRNEVVDPSFSPEHNLTLLLKDLVAAFLLNNKQLINCRINFFSNATARLCRIRLIVLYRTWRTLLTWLNIIWKNLHCNAEHRSFMWLAQFQQIKENSFQLWERL